MRSLLRRTAAICMTAMALIAVTSPSAGAQIRSSSAGGFGMGYTDVGPVIGLGGLAGDADISFGGRLEHAIKALPDLANGILGIQGHFDYYSVSGVKFTFLGGTVNYHFKLDEPKLDPFFGLGLGYNIVSCSGTDVCDNSDLDLIGRIGARWFFSPSTAFYADVGAGPATLNLGLMFKLR